MTLMNKTISIEVKAVRDFFRNGEWIKKGEIVLVDKEAYKQLVQEEEVCEKCEKEVKA